MIEEAQNVEGVDFAALLDSLDETPYKLTALIAGLSDAEVRLKHSPDEFSALENICHLRDLELQAYASRIRRMLDETDPVLNDFDGARVAAQGNYHNEQLQLALQAFHAARKGNLEKLRSLNGEQLRREGRLEGVGKITLRRLAELMREHDQGHLEDLRVLRGQLNRP